MKQNKQVLLASVGCCLCISACSEQKKTSQEEVEVRTMDSTSRSIKESADKLDEQTKKVEASLEQLDNEFNNP